MKITDTKNEFNKLVQSLKEQLDPKVLSLQDFQDMINKAGEAGNLPLVMALQVIAEDFIQNIQESLQKSVKHKDGNPPNPDGKISNQFLEVHHDYGKKDHEYLNFYWKENGKRKSTNMTFEEFEKLNIS